MAKKVQRQGWTWHHTGSGHVKWIGPDGQCVISASTSGGGRGTTNFKARLRRLGAQL